MASRQDLLDYTIFLIHENVQSDVYSVFPPCIYVRDANLSSKETKYICDTLQNVGHKNVLNEKHQDVSIFSVPWALLGDMGASKSAYEIFGKHVEPVDIRCCVIQLKKNQIYINMFWPSN